MASLRFIHVVFVCAQFPFSLLAFDQEKFRAGEGVIAAALKDLTQSTFGDSSYCIYVHLAGQKSGRTIIHGQSVFFHSNISDVGVSETSLWLKREARCVLAIVETGDRVILLKALELVKPVNSKLVVVLQPAVRGHFAEKMPFINTRIVWIYHQRPSDDVVVVSIKCPTVTSETIWPIQHNINLWRQHHGFVIDFSVLPCRNPMYAQNLTLYHHGVPIYTIQSPESGEMIGGRIFKLFQVISQVYHFSIAPALSDLPAFHPSNMSWSGAFGSVIRGEGFAGIGGWYEVSKTFMDLTAPTDWMEQIFVSRKPISLSTYGNLAKPFSPLVWTLICAALAIFGIMFYIIHKVYLSNASSRGLVRPEHSSINFILYSFAKITEPEALPWFPYWSTGRMMVLLWAILATFLTMFYSSNLRAHLMAAELEKPIDTLQDVISSGGTPYIYSSAHEFRKDYLEATGQTGSLAHQIAVLAERKNGYYDTQESNGPPNWAGKDVIKNRATVLVLNVYVPFMYWNDRKHFHRQQIHTSRESTMSYYECLVLTKHSPATPFVDKVVRRTSEAGLISKFQNEFLPLEQLIELEDPVAPLEPMDLRTFYPAFGILFVGLATALIDFLAERLVSRNLVTEVSLEATAS